MTTLRYWHELTIRICRTYPVFIALYRYVTVSESGLRLS